MRSKFRQVRIRFRGWLHVQGYLEAPLEALDDRSAQLVGESEAVRRKVMLHTELRARTLAGQSRSAGLAIFVAALASGGSILTTLSITVLSVFLASGATDYGLEGEVPARVANTLEGMMDLAFWPATVVIGLLAFISILVVVGAFTRDREGALAAMRLDTYTRALTQAAAPEPVVWRPWWLRRRWFDGIPRGERR